MNTRSKHYSDVLQTLGTDRPSPMIINDDPQNCVFIEHINNEHKNNEHMKNHVKFKHIVVED